MLVGIRPRYLSATLYYNVSFDIILLYKSFLNNITACITVTYIILKLLPILSFENLINLLFDVSNIRRIVHTYATRKISTYDIILVNIDDHPIRFSHCYIFQLRMYTF